jgi:penicillin-binding protein 1A
MLLTNEISLKRKIKEILLASRIEAAAKRPHSGTLPQSDLSRLAGLRRYTAALTYFNKSLDELTLGEAAFLASLPKAPNLKIGSAPAPLPQ